MCRQCDYTDLLKRVGVGLTAHRMRVLEVIGDSPCPLSHREIHRMLKRSRAVDRVTVYRILDLLVDKGVVQRISSGDRGFRYGLAPSSNHPPHHHFFCSVCGNMECLDPGAIPIDLQALQRSCASLIRNVEVRLDGICGNCLENRGAKHK
ncbi:MAG TPA: Fur family transcriptional regulator [Syntrophobacter fumaroxidans]|nr:Fur family transcriptional regulator [Syntrophobacter fumaroxidans]